MLRLKEFEQMDCYHFQRPANSEQYFLDLTIDRLSWWKSVRALRLLCSLAVGPVQLICILTS